MKKQIPLEVLSTMQPFADKNAQHCKAVPDSKVLFKLIDNDPASDYYFEVTAQETSNSKRGYLIAYKPKSHSEVTEYKTWIALDSLTPYAENWVKLLEIYNSITTIFDDPLLRQYESEFCEDFKIMDDDADNKTFDFGQQLLINNYIDKINGYLDEANFQASEDVLEDLKVSVKELHADVIVDSKNHFMKKLFLVWAKFRKLSIKGCDFVIKEFAKEVIKEAIKKGINIQWDQLPHYVDQAKQHLIS